MKRILDHTRHWLQAKGRHGTHSPFVYAFVEQVLRGARNMSAPMEVTPAFTARETGLLVRTFGYLDKKVVYADAALLPFCRWLLEAAGSHASLKKLEPAMPIVDEDVLLFCLCTAATVTYLKEVSEGHTVTVVLSFNHRDAASGASWKEAVSIDAFKMAIDAWHFGLLSNHPDFKWKQFFRLR